MSKSTVKVTIYVQGSTKITGKRENKISQTYQVFFSVIENANTFSDTIEDSLHPRFKRISDRITTSNSKQDVKHHLNIIVAYAPTLIRREKDSQIGEDFYRQLDQITSKHNKDKHLLLVLGYFSSIESLEW